MRPAVVSKHVCRPTRKFAALKPSLLLICLGALAGCSSTGTQRYAQFGSSGQIDPRYGVRASPRVVADGDEVPKGGGNYMVGKPYTIAGHTYYPSEKPYSAVGVASWYGSDFHGRRTANGEIFDRNSISAAHPTMPLPSYARVTNLRNARSIIVRVNDRGPYHGGRVMDVSQRVAEALDFHGAGTARVKVEWIGRAGLDGDDDNKLLATLRDDGPATLDGAAPVMTAGRGEPNRRTAREQREIAPPETSTRIALDRETASEYQATAYASQDGGETLAYAARAEDPASARRQETDQTAASVDDDQVATTRHSKAAAPLPPVRPASFGHEASARTKLRQAMN
jgi:rare lipoprotein A